MPRMDGLEALPLLRVAAPEARMVVLSGFSERGSAEAARRAGADLYLEKGLAPAELLAALEETVDCGTG
jgi:DNA-binding NarL/FixJ family response regulator